MKEILSFVKNDIRYTIYDIRTMFTGLVEEVGVVKRVGAVPHYGLEIRAEKVGEEMEPSHSIAINGVCLTVTDVSKNIFSVEIIPQTLEKTNLSHAREGAKVNLERALLSTSRLGGHMVTGDIDGVGRIIEIFRRKGQVVMQVEPPLCLMKYIAEQGRITLEGVSLTIASCQQRNFTVCLIPFTLNNTTLGSKKKGDLLNLEADIISKYLEKLIHNSHSYKSIIDQEFLRKVGY